MGLRENGPNFEFYVVNENFNQKKMVMWNIFNNCIIYDWTLQAVKKYVRSPQKFKRVKWGHSEEDRTIYGFEAFCEELRGIFMHELWSRCEYEFCISPWICRDDELQKRTEKWDGFKQVEPNIPVIAREVIYQYKLWKKENKSNDN